MPSERVRVRVSLSYAEALVHRRLGWWRAGRVQWVEHIHQSKNREARPLRELVGEHWPDENPP